MSSPKYTYNTRLIAGGIFLWELLFWALFAVVLWMMDAFSDTAASGQLAFKDEDKLDYLLVLIPVIGAFLWFILWKNKRLHQLGDVRLLSLIVQPIDSSVFFSAFSSLGMLLFFSLLPWLSRFSGTKKFPAHLKRWKWCWPLTCPLR